MDWQKNQPRRLVTVVSCQEFIELPPLPSHLNQLILQHPMLQHPLLHNPMLQHPLLHHPILEHLIVQHPLLQYPIIQQPVVQQPLGQQSTEQQSTEQQSTEQQSTEQQSTEQQSTEQQSTEQQSTEQHSTEQHSTEQHSTELQLTELQSTGLQPMVQQPLLKQPLLKQPLLKQPLLKQPLVQWPMVQQSTVQQPMVQWPGIRQSYKQSLSPAATAAPVGPVKKPGVPVQWMVLNKANAFNFVSMHGELLTEATATQWHKIIIKTPIPENERKFVISAINKRISPFKLVPYFFNFEYGHITFHVNLCDLALKTLCKKDLTVPYYSSKFDKIEMIVMLFCKNFHLTDALKTIVSKRLDCENKFLDLSYINTDPEVQKLLYDPSDTWHILDHLINVGEVMEPELTSLSLVGNELQSLNNPNYLIRATLRCLKVLDLTNNKLRSVGSCFLPHTLRITELYLHCNPVCETYEKDTYVSAMQITFPSLLKLDGTYLHGVEHLPFWKPNFIVNSSSDDSAHLADQFVEHFFTLYDETDRRKLRGLYHKDAYFSMTSMCLEGQLTTPTSSLSAYITESRNLLYYSDMSEVSDLLTSGSENILKRLCQLPMTVHDPYSFTVDILLHSTERSILTVTGMFCEICKEKQSPRYFMRTFVLTSTEKDVYEIINDIMYVTNAATRQAEEAFRFEKPFKKVKKKQPTPDLQPKPVLQPKPNLSKSEKASMIGLVQKHTNMSAKWSRKCLDDAHWDIKEALEVFVELYKISKIPDSAFLNSRWQQ